MHKYLLKLFFILFIVFGLMTVQSMIAAEAVASDYGDGVDGSFVVSTTENLNSNGHAPKYSVAVIDTASVELSELPIELVAGDEVILINLQGTADHHQNVGNYEFLRVDSITDSTVTFTSDVTKVYGKESDNLDLTGQKIMLQRVPNYTDITVNAGGKMTVSAWDGSTGGVLAFRVSGPLDVQEGGSIDASGLGYRGGAGIEWGSHSESAYQGESYAGEGIRSYLNNFGGGGGGHGGHGNWIGAGGSYGTAGWEDIDINTAGEVYGDSNLNQLFLGSGGGGRQSNWDWCSAPGGSGGGIVAIHAQTITGNGKIHSNGSIGTRYCTGSTYESSGSGSGGSMLIETDNFIMDRLGVTASGFAGPLTTAGWTAGGAGRMSISSDSYTPLNGSKSYYFSNTSQYGMRAVTLLSYEEGVQYQISIKESITLTSGSLNEGEYFEIKNYNLPYNELIKIEIIGNGIVYHTDSEFTHASDDLIVLAQGRNGFVDKEFYIHSPITGYSPRLVIVGLEDNILVDIDDITDDDDDVTGISLNIGNVYVEELDGASTLHLTSSGNIYAYWGIMDDSGMEIVPSLSGQLTGNEFYVATPCFIGVMPLGDGNVTITRLRDNAIVYDGPVTTGNAIFTNDNAGFNSNDWSGVEVLYLTSDVPVYSWISDYNNNNKMLGSMPIPPVDDLSKEFYLYAEGHSNYEFYSNMYAYEDNTNVIITDLTDGSASTTAVINKGEFLKSPPFNGHNLHIETDKRSTVILYHSHPESAGAILTADNSSLHLIPMDFNNWNKMQCGSWEETNEGIKVYGTDYRMGNYLLSKTVFNFIDKEVYVKWKANGNGTYSGFYPAIFGIGGAGGFTTGWSYGDSTLISDDTWYYTRFKVNPDKTYEAVTSTNDYDTNGGTIVKTYTKTISDTQWEVIEKTYIQTVFGDNYGGTGAYMVIGEVKTDALPVVISSSSSTLYDFENDTNIPSEFNHNGDWVIDNTGADSSRSLHITTNQTSSITLDVTNAVSVSFKVKVLIASNYDNFRFLIDNVSKFGSSGDEYDCWNEYSFVIPQPGTHTLEWKYNEDTTYSGQSSGSSVWIDDIQINYSSEDMYTITASADDNGSILPAGEVIVPSSEDKTFSIIPDPDYEILDVVVDGESLGALTSYTFPSVNSDHTIEAYFAPSIAYNVWLDPENHSASTTTAFALDVKLNSGAQKLGSYEFEILFSTTYVKVDTSKGTDGVEPGADGFLTFANTDNDTGTLTVNGFDINGTGPGEEMHVLTIYFIAQNTVGSTQIDLIVNQLKDEQGYVIEPSLGQCAMVEIRELICGDVNNDGVRNILDALLTARKSSGLPVDVFIDNAGDVNCDGAVNIIDALLIARDSAGLPVNWCCD
jgi:hypothetical protein